MEYYNYQDPDTAYGYEGYGYGEHENVPENQEPPPSPDKNWEDPQKTNREYVRKLQLKKSFVHKGFEALRQEGVFLLEVQVESFALKKDILEVEKTSDEKGKFYLTQVQFWNIPFKEVNGIGVFYGGDNEHKKISITKHLNYSQLFQNINSFFPKSDLKEEPSEAESVDKKSGSATLSSEKDSLVLTSMEETPKIVEEDFESEEEEEEEMDDWVVMKGVSMMFGMTGFKMIQTLQMFPIKVRVVQVEITSKQDEIPIEESKDVVAEEVSSSKTSSLVEEKESVSKESIKPTEERVETVLAEASITIPELLREAVLKDSFASDSGTYNLPDPEGEFVGRVQVSINVKCYGRAVINCMNRWGYDHTTLMTCDPSKEDKFAEEPFVPELDNVLLRIFQSKQKSAQLLRKCLEEESRKRKCRWYELARECLPACPIPESTSMEELEKQELGRELAWRKLKQICRQLKTQKPRKNSLYDRLEEVKIPVEGEDKIQTGIAILDVDNPFKKEANKSIVTNSSSGSKRRRSTNTSGRSSQNRASKKVSIVS